MFDYNNSFSLQSVHHCRVVSYISALYMNSDVPSSVLRRPLANSVLNLVAQVCVASRLVSSHGAYHAYMSLLYLR